MTHPFEQRVLRWAERSPKSPLEWDFGAAAAAARHEVPAERTLDVECVLLRGFIANRHEVARDLAIDRTASDQAIVETAYRRWGLDFARRLAGPLTVVLWDRSETRLVASADRSGEHRLFYGRRADRLLLGDGVGQILDRLDGQPTINMTAATLHVCGAPLPLDQSFFNEVFALHPGNLLVADESGETTDPFWRLEPRPDLAPSTGSDCVEALRERISGVVSEYLGEKETGIALSGGVDSPAVAALIRSVEPDRRLHSFRLVAPEHTESETSGLVARQLACTDHPIDISRLWPLSSQSGLATTRESPNVPIFAEMQEALMEAVERAGVGVLFTGWGGDELFGGAVAPYADLLLTGEWGDLWAQVRERMSDSRGGFLGDAWRLALKPLIGPFFDSTRHLREHPVPWLRRSHRGTYRAAAGTLARAPRMLPAQRRRWRMLRNPSSVQILGPFIEAGRRHGVAIRSPLTDHRLKEFIISLPVAEVSRAGRRKWIARQMLLRDFAEPLVDRLGKVTDVFLTQRGLRENEVDQVRSLMHEMRAEDLGLIDGAVLRRSYEDYLAGRTDDLSFWSSLTLEAWLRQHF